MRFKPVFPKSPPALPAEPAPVITWRCYEAPGSVNLTEQALLSHVLILGSTGAGKSTLLTSALHQLFRHEAGNPAQKPGLLILDLKSDSVPMIRALARAAGREGDVVVLGPQGDHHLDLFGRLRSLEDVEFMTRRLLSGTRDMGLHNAYFNEARYAMIEAAMTLLAVTQPQCGFDVAVEFMRGWFFNLSNAAKSLMQVVKRAQRFLERLPAHAPAAARRQVQNALDQVALWKDLDSRTRSNLQSCMINALRPLMGVAAARCFEADNRPAFTPADIPAKGSLCVVSINALAEPDLAQLLSRLLRHEFFDAVQRRVGANHRLTGLVADEYPLVAGPEDVEQLATVRSRRCFVLAAAQGVASLDERLGPGLRRAILLNFNTLVFMRTREEETGDLASVSLGRRKEPPRRSRSTERDDGFKIGLELARFSQPPPVERLICPLGALGRLEPHQAFVVSADGSVTEWPVWFVPHFEDPRFPSLATPVPPGEQKGFRVIDTVSPEHVHALMRRRGMVARWTPELVLAATELCRPNQSHSVLLDEAICFFRGRCCLVPTGLKTLPACWLAALPRVIWRLRRRHWTHLPFMIRSITQEQGVLVLAFTQEQPPESDRITLWDEVRLAVNRSVYPSLWRPLRPRDAVRLWIKRPDLRPASPTCQPEVQ